MKRKVHGAWRMALVLAMLYALCPMPKATAQGKGKLEGIIYLANDKTVVMNAEMVKILTANLGNIASIGGKTTFLVPVEKQFKKRLRTRIVDGFLVQYAWTGKDVSLQKPKTKYKEFNFLTKRITEKSENDDNNDPFKPSDTVLKAKVKEKDEKAKVAPGQVKPK